MTAPENTQIGNGRTKFMSSLWTPEKIHQRRWFTLIAICIAVTITSIDNTIMNVGLPSIVREVGASQAQLQWLIDSYTIVFACLLLTMGAIGDKWGRHRTMIIGLVIFGVFSAYASQADSANALIIARGLMGIGGALILPATLAILSNTFEGKERSKAIGIGRQLRASELLRDRYLVDFFLTIFGGDRSSSSTSRSASSP